MTQPYSDQDPTWYMPLYFYELGFWQKLLGPGMLQGRLLSALLGALSGLLVVDIVRRITGNVLAGALAATVLLTIPAVTFYFGTATPIATVSLLVLFALWLTLTGIGRQSLWRSLCLGMVFSALYFFRQNMILLVVALAPLYILGAGRSRIVHSIAVLIGLIAVATPLLVYFPDRLALYAIRLPVITPMLIDFGLFQNPLLLIESGTLSNFGLGLAVHKWAWADTLTLLYCPILDSSSRL